jgi:RNA polymerase sigma-70 factor (ECF subfamily)
MTGDEQSMVAAARAGDAAAFTRLVERYRRELQLHCYRMVGSLDDSEDLVQETFLRAWRSRTSFGFNGRSSFRAWLYRIATNACFDVLARSPRRVLASQLGPPSEADAPLQPPADLPWLGPYPDRLLEGLAPSDAEPDVAVVRKETIEIAFLAAIQLLTPKQRAVLILRDVLGWSAKETAALLDASVASANSALQRARATLERHLPRRRLEGDSAVDPSAEERAVLQRFMDAFERADVAALAEVLREDARANMPPYPMWHDGRHTIVTSVAKVLDPASPDHLGEWRVVEAHANLQPTAAFYVRRTGESEFRAFALDVLRIEDGAIAEITSFPADVFEAFGLPPVL